MKKLLCAAMVGAKCLAWHPAGTKKKDIIYYGEGHMTCPPIFILNGPLTTSQRSAMEKECWINETGEHRFGLGCANYCSKLITAEIVDKNTGYAYWSLTKSEVAIERERQRRINLNPIQLQNEDAGE